MIELLLFFAQATATPSLVQGEKIFSTTCAVGYCHGQGGTANRGPRLKGRSFEPAYVERVIRSGIPSTGMPGFATRLKPAELDAVIAYVKSISNAGPGEPPKPPEPAPGQPQAQIPEVPVALKKGRDLFFDANRGIRCSTCHEAQGLGIKVAAMQPGQVRRVTLANGESMPAVMMSQAGNVAKFYDMTAAPPVLRTVDKNTVQSSEPEKHWKHPVANYSAAEMAEVKRYTGWLLRK